MVKIAKEPNENDILLGRGGKNNQWVGNERLRNMARRHCLEYQKASKKGKSQISREIVQNIRRMKPSGRFLRKCSGSLGEWEDVGDDIAREKTSQVLRDAIQARKSFSGDGEQLRCYNSTFHQDAGPKVAPRKTKTLLQQSLRSSYPKSLAQQASIDPSVAYGSNSSTCSPDNLSLHYSHYSHGRISMSEPINSNEEDVLHFSITSLEYQYPVTPASSRIAPSTERKRQRFCLESPLIQGYHRYPYPTPIRRTTTPVQLRSRSLTFSPPTYRRNREDLLSCSRDDSGLRRPPKGNELIDVPLTPLQKTNEYSERKRQENQDFDSLLNDDVLSDSDSKNDSTPLFPSSQTIKFCK